MSDPGVLAASLLQKYFPKFGSFRKSVTYQSYPQATYATATGIVTMGTPATQSLQVIFTKADGKGIVEFNDNEAPYDIDAQVIFPALDLGSIIPKVGDVVLEGTVRWVVIAIDNDPKPAHYSLLCRAVR